MEKIEMKIYKAGLILLMVANTLSVFGFSTSDSIFNENCKGLDFPILYISTVDGVMPTCQAIYPPPGCGGVSITGNEKVPAQMWLVLNGDTLYNSGEYKQDTSGITIKVRGNSTGASKLEKKPYKIKLQKKKDLLFRNDENKYADKEWVLLCMNFCHSIVGNMTNRAMRMEWTPAQTPVFLFLNDNFRGVYLLSENVKRNEKCRVDVSKTGYLYEYDTYWWNEDMYVESSYRHNYTLKYPESKDILPWQLEYLSNHIAALETAYVTPYALDSAIDIDSYVRWLWIHDILGNYDSWGSNVFLMKYDTAVTSKQKMVCAWDFDRCFEMEGWSNIHKEAWFSDFFNLPQEQFVAHYISMYDSKVKDLFDTLVNDIQTLKLTEQTATLDSALILENSRWLTQTSSASIQLQEMADYLSNRKARVDSMMNEIKAQHPTSIPNQPTGYVTASAYFDLYGRPIHIITPNQLIITRNKEGKYTKKLWSR